MTYRFGDDVHLEVDGRGKTALHEAGHAIVAALLGSPPTIVLVTGEGNGYNAPGDGFADAHLGVIATIRAGGWACLVALGADDPTWGCRGDGGDFEQLDGIGTLIGSEAVDAAARYAIWLAVANRGAILAFAKQLDRAGVLKGDDLQAVLAEAFAGNPIRVGDDDEDDGPYGMGDVVH